MNDPLQYYEVKLEYNKLSCNKHSAGAVPPSVRLWAGR